MKSFVCHKANWHEAHHMMGEILGILACFQKEMMAKEDPIKIEEKELSKEVDQETMWQLTGLSTAHKWLSTRPVNDNQRRTKVQIFDRHKDLLTGPVDNPSWPVDSQ